MPLGCLTDKLDGIRGKAYSYVLSTVTLDPRQSTFEQRGSAPNFQGGLLTLCTCKHQMRSRLSVAEWENHTWLVGFTSRTLHAGKHWLFYLAKVKAAYESHSDLWSHLDADPRNAKAAHRHFLGDLFKPDDPHLTGDARFSPSRYVTPAVHAHRQHPGHDGWENDINYRNAATSGHPPLLVADPKWTFLWNEPVIYLAKNHCRDYLKWSSLQELVAQLRKAG